MAQNLEMYGTNRICMWSGPRNISTAMMYSFAQRSDTRVFDEPLYAHYLSHSDARKYHPGAEEILMEMEQDGERVVHWMLEEKFSKPVVFFKCMAHHLVELDWEFLFGLNNFILTRHPREMIPSLTAHIKDPNLHDTGLKIQLDLVKKLASRGIEIPVLDSKEVLLNPAKVLAELCRRLGIPFEESMLSWKPGPRKEDGSWAKYWYSDLHKSDKFIPYKPKTSDFPRHLEPLLEECMPFYEELSSLAIRAD